ncbi:hypothetical protein VX037_08040 [Gordonia sp. Z-3]|nr:hypothetical protein [Gordonia sp. Z-3]MED5800972.1 hypothetical protein [Gordonia sp. Z-3]
MRLINARRAIAAAGSAALGVGIVGSATLGSSLLPALLFAS